MKNNNVKSSPFSNDDAKNALELLIRRDQELTESGQVPVLFWYSVITPKPKEQISDNI